jgi:hypothetical protein
VDCFEFSAKFSPKLQAHFIFINPLVVSGQNEKISVGDGQKMTRTYCIILAKLKDKEEARQQKSRSGAQLFDF